MDKAGKNLFAGSGRSGQQNAGFRRSYLFGHFQNRFSFFVPIDQRVVFTGGRRQNGADKFGIGRQGNIFFGAGFDCLNRQSRIVGYAASNNQHVNPFAFQRRNKLINV